MTATMTFRRGEPVIIGERVLSGEILPNHSMRARMKPAYSAASLSMPGDDVAAVDPPFTSTFVSASGDNLAHYLHSLTAAQSLSIDDGVYIFDSAMLLNGVVQDITDSIRVVIRNSASG